MTKGAARTRNAGDMDRHRGREEGGRGIGMGGKGGRGVGEIWIHRPLVQLGGDTVMGEHPVASAADALLKSLIPSPTSEAVKQPRVRTV